MIVIQYICVLLYAIQMLEFTYSKSVGKSKQISNVDPIKCPSEDPICSETTNSEYLSVVGYLGSFKYTVWLPYFKNKTNEYVSNGVNDINSEKRYDDEQYVGSYFKGLFSDFSRKYPTHKMKRALELVEEHPPEGTYRPPYEREEPRTIRALPSNIPSMASIPQMPSLPSMPQMPSVPSIPSFPSKSPVLSSMPQPPTTSPVDLQNENRETANDITTMPSIVTTTATDVEVLDTTTEDYGNIGEPNCDYDPFTFVLKCGLNLITSIFGLSDTCCKPLF